MLTQETKRKIDSARQILVGKVPDPKEQVEQITTALIYKFMDDMDKEAQELGGKASFFTNGYQKYAWTKLMDAKLGGHERLDLYLEAITSLSRNPHIPQLFRDIFKDAFLPYRDPETLNMFLKEINGFTYEHSEDLGDAFEYLLSIMGSQGDAGMFRTPRHIIDFIVAAVDPKKGETICDPACGTAGFLISAFKYILKENKEKSLTPDERKNLMDHFVGYDISPDMVRLSKVNLYLHGFPSPTIFEYDTLSSEEKWDENFDVMLANPPFMSPTGGIRPHKRFSVQANRSEVLFVDYILEHLRPNGRAGIIVPEGIIFKSEGAYKTLRKMLIEDGLLAVVSLPAGVFNPYAGVKTSILLFDNGLAKKTKEILFLKIQNDGYSLGAQRREIDKNDLPLALEIIKKYRAALKDSQKFELNAEQAIIAHLVAKDKIAESGDYNLSGDRYIEVVNFVNQKWPVVELGELCDFLNGLWKGKKPPYEKVNVIRNTNFTKDGKLDLNNVAQLDVEKKQFEKRSLLKGDIILEKSGGGPTQPVGRVILFNLDSGKYSFSNFTSVVRIKNRAKLSPEFLWAYLNNLYRKGYTERLQKQTSGIRNLDFNAYKKIGIPLPPIEIQKEIVEQIEVKQKAIEAAKAVIDSLEKERRYFGQELRKIKDVKWVELGEVAEVTAGQSPEGKYYNKVGEGTPFYQGKTEFTEKYLGKARIWTTKTTKIAEQNDILISVRAPVGPVNIATEKICIGRGLASIQAGKINQMFLFHFLKSIELEIKGGGGAVFDSISKKQIEELKIPLPPLEIQKQLVAEMEEQEKIIEANKKLVGIMEQKISEVLNQI
ncbi:MAG TPA: N-6 DNA methylase [bacterium]|nr:N-6 DNA methylase [bacterium]